MEKGIQVLLALLGLLFLVAWAVGSSLLFIEVLAMGAQVTGLFIFILGFSILLNIDMIGSIIKLNINTFVR